MWDRRELKARGKAAFKNRYWLTVAIALILSIVLGGGIGVTAGSAGGRINFNHNSNTEAVVEQESPIQVNGEDLSFDDLKEAFSGEDRGVLIAIAGVVFAVVLAVGTVSFLIDILLLNPLEVGCQNYFLRNSEGNGQLNDLERGFSPSWGGNVKTMLLRGLFLFLWSLLFLIPGIVKGYSYRMVPYILADHPELSGTQVIPLSRQMMRGNKWRTFVLDLSFLGWEILSLLTLGILGIFYVGPYKRCTDAELYHALKGNVSL